jgi:glycosyltransferase involved in cell wall biosynthesis
MSISQMLSFIVPAYNEEFELPSTLAAIKNAAGLATAGSSRGGQDQEYEIVVVDDGSTDATAGIAEQSGAKVVSINRRQIAAARNAGARAARGDILFFVDADTRINAKHVDGAIAAVQNGNAGGSARIEAHGPIPFWAKIFLLVFCTLYFAANLGAGAFLFTTRRNFEAVGGFDEKLFVGEEVYFSLALGRIGRFKILREPIITSGRKLRMYSAREIFGNMFAIIIGGKRAAGTRDKLDIWYNGKRETPSAFAGSLRRDKSI